MRAEAGRPRERAADGGTANGWVEMPVHGGLVYVLLLELVEGSRVFG